MSKANTYWRTSVYSVPFICHYAVYVFTPPEDECSQVRGDLHVFADSVEEAMQKAECRLSRLGFNRVVIFREDIKKIRDIEEVSYGSDR